MNKPCTKNGFVEPIQQICPTGKSLPIIRNRVKPLREKYFCFTELKIALYPSHPVPLEGALRNGHQRGAGMRWTRMAPLTRALEADGKDVWS